MIRLTRRTIRTGSKKKTDDKHGLRNESPSRCARPRRSGKASCRGCTSRSSWGLRTICALRRTIRLLRRTIHLIRRTIRTGLRKKTDDNHGTRSKRPSRNARPRRSGRASFPVCTSRSKGGLRTVCALRRTICLIRRDFFLLDGRYVRV